MSQAMLIHAKPETIEHKLDENVEDGYVCHWATNGTVRQVEPGSLILFEDDGRIHGWSVIIGIEEGRVWFAPVSEIDIPCPKTPPNQGFTYVDSDDVGIEYRYYGEWEYERVEDGEGR